MKKFLSMFIVGATLLLISGCGNSKSDIVDTNNDNTTKTEATALNECKKACDMFVSEKIKTQDCYTLCETSQKLESNDVNDCDKIDETSGSFITKDICIQDKAIQAKNPEYCEKISEDAMKDTCYMGLASEMKDKTVCEKIKNDIFKSTCINDKE